MGSYNEKERVEIAQKEYNNYQINDNITINKSSTHIGTVTKIYDDMKTDLRAIVVKNSSGV